jgi:hypothetical protein
MRPDVSFIDISCDRMACIYMVDVASNSMRQLPKP